MTKEIKRLKSIRTISIIWMLVFFGFPTIVWGVAVMLYLASGVWADVSTQIVTIVNLVFVIGLPGYYSYLSSDSKLLSLEHA